MGLPHVYQKERGMTPLEANPNVLEGWRLNRDSVAVVNLVYAPVDDLADNIIFFAPPIIIGFKSQCF